jgi:glycosyl transferase family 25
MISIEKMEILVISLPLDLERREVLRTRFPRRFKDFKIDPALDFRNGLPPALFSMIRFCKRNYRNPLSPPEIGCSLSHMKAYETFLSGSASHALILEDDVLGSDLGIDEIERAITYLEDDAFLLCGGQQGLRNTRYLYGWQQREKLYRLPRLVVRFTARTCCYVVTRKRAAKLLAQQRSCLDRADNWKRLLSDCTNIFFMQALAHPQESNSSHIDSMRISRSRDGVWRMLLADGVFTTLSNQIVKIFIRSTARLRNLRRPPRFVADIRASGGRPDSSLAGDQ